MIIDELFEGPQLCPECGGISFSDLILAEKKDACYYKVKASAKVWPSAYASGRLVQCRKKGAANYGKSKTESIRDPNEMSGVNSMRKKLGNIIKQAAQDDEVAYNASKLYRELWNIYGGDIDAIIAERSIFELEKLARELVAVSKQGVAEQQELDEKWSQKYKKSINCANPKGFSQKAHCAGREKNEDVAESYYDRDDYYSARMGGEYGKGMTAPTYGSDGGDGPGRGDIHKGQTKHLSADPFGRSLGPVPQGARGRIYSTDEVDETRRGQVPMTLKPGETDNLEPEDFAGFKKLPAYQQGQAAQQKAGKQLIQKSPYTFQSDQDWAYRQGATDAQRAAMFANFGGTKPLTTAEGEQQPGADYRDPKEVDYDDDYDAMVARVKKLAGLGPMKTVYDPTKRVYRNMPTAVQPKKQ